ncbi:hypothetical protein SAMN05421720_10227 [Rhodospira trueperi]|uniref:Uncharacterized protein n=1 Tax=Rhodospira trueperi TaxID=69960 RepID=A0A1G6YKJ9_9PROT|nr:hypothetical protein SAMN05421720_10227 [Rhodospira trueperi]
MTSQDVARAKSHRFGGKTCDYDSLRGEETGGTLRTRIIHPDPV